MNIDSFGENVVVKFEEDTVIKLEESWCNCDLTSLQIQIFKDGQINEFFDFFYEDSTLLNYSRGERINDSLHFRVFRTSRNKPNTIFTYYLHKFDSSQYHNVFEHKSFQDTVFNYSNGLKRNDFLSMELDIVNSTISSIHDQLQDSIRQTKSGFNASNLISSNKTVLSFVQNNPSLFTDEIQNYDKGGSFFYELKMSEVSNESLITLEKEELMSSRLLYSAAINKILYLRTHNLKFWEAYYQHLYYHRKVVREDPLNYWALYHD